MKKTITALLITILILAQSICACAGVKVLLKQETEAIPASQIMLKDVSDIQGPAALVERVGNLVISTAPIAGKSKTIETRYIRLRTKALYSKDFVKVIGPDEISIIGKSVKISSDELFAKAKDLIQNQLKNENQTYEITADRMPRDIVAPYGDDVQINTRLMNNTVRVGCNTVALDITVDNKLVATTSAALRVKAVGDVLIAINVIRQGEALTSENTSWEKRDISSINDAIIPAGNDSAIPDYVASRLIRQGCTIRSIDVTEPAAIHKGDTVSLLVISGGVKLHTKAEAKQSGKVGDMITVRSEASKEDIKAEITEPGIVEVNI